MQSATPGHSVGSPDLQRRTVVPALFRMDSVFTYSISIFVQRFPTLPSVLALAAVIVTCGVASDFLRDRVLLSTAAARKMVCSGGRHVWHSHRESIQSDGSWGGGQRDLINI